MNAVNASRGADGVGPWALDLRGPAPAMYQQVRLGVAAKDLATGRRLLAELTAAKIAQEEAVKNLPAATKAVYIQKAKAYIVLKKLARAGRDTF